MNFLILKMPSSSAFGACSFWDCVGGWSSCCCDDCDCFVVVGPERGLTDQLLKVLGEPDGLDSCDDCDCLMADWLERSLIDRLPMVPLGPEGLGMFERGVFGACIVAGLVGLIGGVVSESDNVSICCVGKGTSGIEKFFNLSLAGVCVLLPGGVSEEGERSFLLLLLLSYSPPGVPVSRLLVAELLFV